MRDRVEKLPLSVVSVSPFTFVICTIKKENQLYLHRKYNINPKIMGFLIYNILKFLIMVNSLIHLLNPYLLFHLQVVVNYVDLDDLYLDDKKNE